MIKLLIISKDNVDSLVAPARVSDSLPNVPQAGTRRLVEAAVGVEFEEDLAAFAEQGLPDARHRVVRLPFRVQDPCRAR